MGLQSRRLETKSPKITPIRHEHEGNWEIPDKLFSRTQADGASTGSEKSA
jgi:hypothetical protein